MLTMNIGAPKKPGQWRMTPEPRPFTVIGGGADIWDVKDEFNFAFQQVSAM
jgi:hypothetical protein